MEVGVGVSHAHQAIALHLGSFHVAVVLVRLVRPIRRHPGDVPYDVGRSYVIAESRRSWSGVIRGGTDEPRVECKSRKYLISSRSMARGSGARGSRARGSGARGVWQEEVGLEGYGKRKWG